MTDRNDSAGSSAMLTWASLVHAGLFLSQGLDHALQDACGLTLAEQDLLSQVSKAPGELRMGDLAERLFFSPAGMTKLVDRLEASGLVERQRAASDRRAITIGITERGREELAGSRRVLRRWVQRNFSDRLEDRDLAALGTALENLLRAHDRWEPQLQHLGTTGRSP